MDVLIPGRSALALVGARDAPQPPRGGASEPAGELAGEPAGLAGGDDVHAASPGRQDGAGQDPRDPAGPEEGRPPEQAGGYFTALPVEAITANPRQPRQVFDADAMAELVESVRTVGLLQPVVVRPAGTDRYELVMGERRWRACLEAGLDTIPAIVRSTEDTDLLRDALLENLHRASLNPLEEAAAYDQLLQDFGCTHDELARRIGRSRPQISNTLRLLKLPPLVQRRVAAGVLSAGHARALLALPDAAGQERLAQRIVAEGLSVRGVEEVVALGEAGADRSARAARAPGARPGPDPALEQAAARLSDRLDTRVKVDLGRSKGKIVVEFATVEDLDRIVALLAPEPG